jgi:hypothetical protein
MQPPTSESCDLREPKSTKEVRQVFDSVWSCVHHLQHAWRPTEFVSCVGSNAANCRRFILLSPKPISRACAEVSSSHRYVTTHGNIKLSLLSSFTRSSHIRLLNPAASKEGYLRLHIKRLSCITVMTAEHSKCFPRDLRCLDALFYAIG